MLTLPNDHFIIRAYSPATTIGGGVIVDSMPRKHRLREGAQAVAQLEKLAAPLVAGNEAEHIGLLVEMAGERGMAMAELAARSGSPDDTIKRAVETMTASIGSLLFPDRVFDFN